MNPLTMNPGALLAGTAVALALGFGAGWSVNGWRLHADLADEKREHAEEITKASQAALDDYKTAAGLIKAAAEGAQVDVSGLKTKIDILDRRIRNAPPPPLPADCHPGSQRLRDLSDAAAATDKAAARPVAGR